MAQKSGGGIDPEILKIILLAGGGLLIYNKIFGKSAETKKEIEEEKKITSLPIAKNPLTPAFVGKKAPKGFINYRSSLTVPTVPSNYFSSAVILIHKSIGRFTDDESAIISSIKRAVTKFELNVMAQTYQALYKKDLWFELKDNLSASELLQITSYVNKLPEYIKGYKKIVKK